MLLTARPLQVMVELAAEIVILGRLEPTLVWPSHASPGVDRADSYPPSGSLSEPQ
jgi:hypothetical protein